MATTEVAETILQAPYNELPTLNKQEVAKLLPVIVTWLFAVDMLGYRDVSTILYEGHFEKGAATDLIGDTQMNVSKRRRKVPDPKDGIVKMMIEEVELAMEAEKLPILAAKAVLAHVGKSLPVTVILSPGARTRGFTSEIDCPEQQVNRHIKHKSAGIDERCDSFEHANRRDIAVK